MPRRCQAAIAAACAMLALASFAARDTADGAASKERNDMLPRDLPVFQEQILLAAHRGGMGLWPENTLFAFERALERWPDIFLECDVHLTREGHVVVCHDETVDRTTDGTGRIDRFTLDELQALDAGYRFTKDGGKTFPHRGQGIVIPTLREVLEALPEARFVVELKDGRGLAGAIVEVLRDLDAFDRVIIGSFKPAMMDRVRELAPEALTCYDINTAYTMLQALRDEGWEEYTPGAHLLTIGLELERRAEVTAEEIQQVREKGIVYQIHTVNDPGDMRRYLEMGVCSILTDYPDRLEAVIAEFKEDGGA